MKKRVLQKTDEILGADDRRPDLFFIPYPQPTAANFRGNARGGVPLAGAAGMWYHEASDEGRRNHAGERDAGRHGAAQHRAGL